MDKELAVLLEQLQQDKSLKVWSLIITFFGDVVVSRGGNISAKTIQSVLNAKGISAGAVRTALSRLAGDQWIERQKIGRESYYKLAGNGYEPFEQAASRIYAPPSCPEDTDSAGYWSISIRQPGKPRVQPVYGAIEVGANCSLVFHDHDQSSENAPDMASDNLVFTGELTNVPEWLAEAVIPEAVQQGYDLLIARFSSIKNVEKISPLNCLLIRNLLIHEWRRLLLRTPRVPHALQTAHWPEQICRQFVAQLYHQLLSGSESWLDENATSIHGSLPQGTENIRSRFTRDYQLVR